MIAQRRRLGELRQRQAGLWMGYLRRGSPPGAKGAAIVVYHDEETQNWLSSNASPLTIWEGSRLKMADLEALPIYKRVVDWLPGYAEDTERYFQRLRRLNHGLNISQWRVYKRKVKPTGSALCSASIHLEGTRWRPFSGVGQAKFSFLGVKLEGRKAGRKEDRSRGGGGRILHGKYNFIYLGQPTT